MLSAIPMQEWQLRIERDFLSSTAAAKRLRISARAAALGISKLFYDKIAKDCSSSNLDTNGFSILYKILQIFFSSFIIWRSTSSQSSMLSFILFLVV